VGCQNRAEKADADADAATADADELSDWNVVSLQPDRLLERLINVPSYGGGGGYSPMNALQTLSAVSEFAAENTAKYARSLVQLLPETCRELVDAPRAFAWVHLREEGSREGDESDCRDNAGRAKPGDSLAACGYSLPMLPLAEGLRLALGSPRPVASCGYVAFVGTSPRACGGRSEVLVATTRGCAHLYDWSPAVGGECRLRTEHSFMGRWLDQSSLESAQRKECEIACEDEPGYQPPRELHGM
jgi:hypothetical protein